MLLALTDKKNFIINYFILNVSFFFLSENIWKPWFPVLGRSKDNIGEEMANQKSAERSHGFKDLDTTILMNNGSHTNKHRAK